jgi:6-phosphofructokinase 1
MAGLAGGAEAILIPEIKVDPEALAGRLHEAYKKGKAHAIIVVAEGANFNAESLAKYFAAHKERLGFDLRATILGHVQRGGNPGAFDRNLATRLGAGAVEFLLKGQSGQLIGLVHGDIAATPLTEVVANKKKIDMKLYE